MATAKHILTKILGWLLLVIALNGLGGGYYGMDGAKNVPLEWLAGTPFKTYFVPSLILFICIGCLFFVAGIMVLTHRSTAQKLSRLSGWTLIVWITIQVSMIGFVSWLQPFMFIAGICIVALATLAFNYTQNTIQS